jgi:hypothetical protein
MRFGFWFLEREKAAKKKELTANGQGEVVETRFGKCNKKCTNNFFRQILREKLGPMFYQSIFTSCFNLLLGSAASKDE